MDSRDLVTFDADFPDDAQWDEQGNLVVPGGQAIAEAIKSQLQEEGIFCSDVYQHSWYGWAFDVTFENTKAWCLLQVVDKCILQLEQQKSLISRLFGPSNTAGFDALKAKVHNILTGDKRFSNVLWYSRADYGSGKQGHPSPH